MTRWIQRVPNVDAAWHRMDDPTNPMTITGVLVFDGPVDWEAIKSALWERVFSRYPRFQYQVADGGVFSRPWWVSTSDFKLEDHLTHYRLPGQGTRKELEALVSDLMSRPLDTAKEVCHFHLVDNVEGGSALVGRVHHVVADGLSLAQVLLDLGVPEDPEALDKVKVSEAMKLPRGPFRWASYGLRAVWELLRLITSKDEPKTPIKKALGHRKEAAWVTPIPLEEVKAVAAGLDATINDVLLTNLSHGLSRYLSRHMELPHQLRTFLPFNLRSQRRVAVHEMGNRFGLVLVGLPTADMTIPERLQHVREQMAALKQGVQPMATYGALQAVGLTPLPGEWLVQKLFGPKASLITTNVPGPTKPLLVSGHKVSEIMFWVPQSAGVGVGVSILSYDGWVRMGVAADVGCIPEPTELALHCEGAWREMLAAAGVSPSAPEEV